MKFPLTDEGDDGGSKFWGKETRGLVLGVLSLRWRMVEGWNLEESGVQGQGPGCRHSIGNRGGEVIETTGLVVTGGAHGWGRDQALGLSTLEVGKMSRSQHRRQRRVARRGKGTRKGALPRG